MNIGTEFPSRYLKTFIRYLDITEDYFWEVLDRYRSEKIWRKVNGKWKTKIRVSNNNINADLLTSRGQGLGGVLRSIEIKGVGSGL